MITSKIPVFSFSRDAFDKVDAAVMQRACAAQNHFGHLCKEEVYKNDLKNRLQAAGFVDVHAQVGLNVSHDGFQKTYWLELEGLSKPDTKTILVGEATSPSCVLGRKKDS